MDTTIRPISENDNGMSNNINLNNNVNGIEAITPFNNNQINNPNNIVTPNANLNNSYQKPITNFESNLNNQEMFGNNVAAPQQSQNIYSNTIQPIPETTNYVEQPYQQVNNNILPQNPMSNPYSSINAQNTMNSFMDMGNMQNYNQNNTTIPTPVNQIPTPQPVTPQPIMNGINNNTQMMNQNYGNNMANQQMNQNMPSTEQPGMITNSNIPVNFVFGPQNNNQNM